jgi:uncharacterized protein YqjF (DUF2071 family)
MSFLKAEWRKLALANYIIPPAVLEPYVPAGTELDFWEGHCYASLVGFMFLNTKILGVKIPFHVNFEEVNLRFYVKRKEQGAWKRGVVFIKEIVPKHAITFVANTLYKEHYATMPMKHHWEERADSRLVEYLWKKGGRWHSFQVEADAQLSNIAKGSEAEFITEHYWGYAGLDAHSSNEYEVTHPRWDQYKVRSHCIEADFGMLYGPDFAFLNDQKPASVMLAEGSEITVEGKNKIFV